MGAKVSRTDFEWVYTEEPHASRRNIILEKYPEIRSLFGPEPAFKWQVCAIVVVQLATLPLVQQLTWPTLLALAYCFGAFLNHALMMAIHEAAHNLVFGHNQPTLNRLFDFFANLPIGIPAFISFKKYHLDHHRYQGHEMLDKDLPSQLEGQLFRSSAGKLLWLALQPVLFPLRPMLLAPKPLTALELANVLVQISFNAAVTTLCGWKALGYLVSGSLMAVGLHPVGAHFITDHYMFTEGVETYSYYGPLNRVMFNAGYHNEHHDFPAVPCSRLPEVSRIAREYYAVLPAHSSWWRPLYHFLADPALGPYARVKRKHHGDH